MTRACSSWLLGWLIFTDCCSILKSVTVLILWMLFFWIFFSVWFHAWQLLQLHYRVTRSTRPCGWSTEWISCEVSKSKVEARGNVGKLIYVYFTFTFFFDKHILPNFRISSLVQEFSTNRKSTWRYCESQITQKYGLKFQATVSVYHLCYLKTSLLWDAQGGCSQYFSQSFLDRFAYHKKEVVIDLMIRHPYQKGWCEEFL